MDIGETTIKVGSDAAIGTPPVMIHQPSFYAPKLQPTDLSEIIRLLTLIELNTRPLNLWERIKIWLGIRVHKVT